MVLNKHDKGIFTFIVYRLNHFFLVSSRFPSEMPMVDVDAGVSENKLIKEKKNRFHAIRKSEKIIVVVSNTYAA